MNEEVSHASTQIKVLMDSFPQPVILIGKDEKKQLYINRSMKILLNNIEGVQRSDQSSN
jgi:hypothetical protein